MLALDQATYLGAATVLHAAAGRMKLELPDEHAWALSALAFPYQPMVGDVVLAAGRAGQWYVIGVLKGGGATTLLVPGDLTLAAPHGQIKIAAAQGVEIRGPKIKLRAGRLDLIANSLSQRFQRATQWVKETLQVRVGRLRTRVDSSLDVSAERIRQRAKDDVKIDGKTIHLG